MFIMGKTKPRRRKIDVCKVQCPKEGRPTPPRLPPPGEVRDLLQRIRETLRIVEKVEELGEKGRRLIERLDEEKAEKLMPILAEEWKVDIVAELGKLPEEALKALATLAKSPHFGEAVEHLNSLYSHLDKAVPLLREAAKSPEVLDTVLELLKSPELLGELRRRRGAWADAAHCLAKCSKELAEK